MRRDGSGLAPFGEARVSDNLFCPSKFPDGGSIGREQRAGFNSSANTPHAAIVMVGNKSPHHWAQCLEMGRPFRTFGNGRGESPFAYPQRFHQSPAMLEMFGAMEFPLFSFVFRAFPGGVPV